MHCLPVTFFYPYPEDLERLDTLALDSNPLFWSEAWKTRRRNWILQTYLRLHRAGHAVAISGKVPDEGIVVVGPERSLRTTFLQQYGDQVRPDLVVLGIRADIWRFLFADAEVVQNGKYADERQSFFIPYWPQPGLLPRDPARKERIETIVYKGYTGNLHPDFLSQRWLRFLQEMQIRWVVDGIFSYDDRHAPAWHDYTAADLVLAVRPDLCDPNGRKPASKLVNAWMAGVPALLGPEYAFREQRRSERDFIEVNALEDAMAGVRRLAAHPEKYRAMIDNGLQRAQAFTAERITERWAEVLFERLPALAAQRSSRLARRLPRRVKTAFNLVRLAPSEGELRQRVGERVGGRHLKRLRPW